MRLVPYQFVAGLVAFVALSCVPAHAQECSMGVHGQAIKNHTLHVSGEISAGMGRGYFGVDKENLRNELRVVVEWIGRGGKFRMLPTRLVPGRGPCIPRNNELHFLTATEKNGVRAESVEIWSKKLEKPEDPLELRKDESYHFEGTAEVAESAVKYRIVGELSKRWTDENGDLQWTFDYSQVREGDIADLQPSTGQNLPTQPGQQPAPGSTDVPVARWATLIRHHYNAAGQQPAPDSTELTRARQLLATTEATPQSQQQTIGQIIQALHQNISGAGTHGIAAAAGVSDSVFNTQIDPMSDRMIRELVIMHMQRIAGTSDPR